MPPANRRPAPAGRAPIEDRLEAAGLPPVGRTAWLEIDLDALAGNLALLREIAGPGVRVEPVVKADAFGHGAVPVARALLEAGADGFSVATFDEAVELRAAGIDAPILVLYPVPPAVVETAVRLGIGLTVGDTVLLDRLVRAVASVRPVGGPLAVAIELETGLGRGGFAADAAVRAVAVVDATPDLRLAGAWSHLAAPGDAASARAQGQLFERTLTELTAGGARIRVRHLAASGGLIARSAAVYDAVRPGLAIYGLLPEDLAAVDTWSVSRRMRPVMSLRARPVRVIDLPAGHGISYGPSFVTRRHSRIATLPLGYADGWSRSLSNRARALVRGVPVALVGTVAMDAVMADVTEVPGEPVSVDDEFTLLGTDGDHQIDAHELARLRTTISWEVVSTMSRRLTRVYHRAAVPLSVRSLSAEERWSASGSGMEISATVRSTRS